MALAITDKEYYEDSEHWGENAFVTLENIIDNVMLLADDDSYFKGIKKFRAEILGKLGVKKLNVDIKPAYKAISFQLAPSKTFPHPRYMTNWNRISVINSCEKLQILEINNRAEIHDYLQDNSYELLYDTCGEILEGDSFDAEAGDCCVALTCTDRIHTDCDCNCTDKSFVNSWVKSNLEGKYFEFSKDLVDKHIVIEFISAGLDKIDSCDIKIHHDMELTLMKYIQYNILMGKRNVPNSEWRLYKQEYKSEFKRSERLLGGKITIERILKSVSLRYNN